MATADEWRAQRKLRSVAKLKHQKGDGSNWKILTRVKAVITMSATSTSSITITMATMRPIQFWHLQQLQSHCLVKQLSSCRADSWWITLSGDIVSDMVLAR